MSCVPSMQKNRRLGRNDLIILMRSSELARRTRRRRQDKYFSENLRRSYEKETEYRCCKIKPCLGIEFEATYSRVFLSFRATHAKSSNILQDGIDLTSLYLTRLLKGYRPPPPSTVPS